MKTSGVENKGITKEKKEKKERKNKQKNGMGGENRILIVLR